MGKHTGLQQHSQAKLCPTHSAGKENYVITPLRLLPDWQASWPGAFSVKTLAWRRPKLFSGLGLGNWSEVGREKASSATSWRQDFEDKQLRRSREMSEADRLF